jgi:hypothetical protein
MKQLLVNRVFIALNSMDKLKQNLALVVGLAIPIFMMVVIAGVIYFPRLLNPVEPTQYDFVYAVGDGVAYSTYGGSYPYPAKGVWQKYSYRVVDGQLVRQEALPIPKEYENMPVATDEPRFYVYHVSTHKSTEISFEEVSQLPLDPGPKSPDGFEVVRGNGRGGGMFPFGYSGGDNYNKKYIRKEYYAEPLDLNLPQDYYGEFFVAWIIQEPSSPPQ